MADQIHPMTEAKARKMKPGTLAVGTALGLYLVKRSTNVGTFIFRYTEAKTGKRRTYTLGRYPDLTIDMATNMTLAKRQLLAAGVDILAERDALKVLKAQMREQKAKKITFEEAASMWIRERVNANYWANNPTGARVVSSQFRMYVYPVIGALPLDQITPKLVADCLRPIWKRIHSTATKIRGNIFQFFRWAIAEGHCKLTINPVSNDGPLPALLEMYQKQFEREHTVDNHAACSVEEIPQLFQEMSEWDSMSSRMCRFAILTCARSKAVRLAEWSEIDLEKRTWTIPTEHDKIKKPGRDRTIFLSDEAITLLNKLPRFKDTNFVFPNKQGEAYTVNAPIEFLEGLHENRKKRDGRGWIDPVKTKNTGKAAVITLHGTARASFRTWAKDDALGNNRSFDQEAVELCLLHSKKDQYDGAYDRAPLANERRRIMSAWGKYCYSLLNE